MLRIGVIGAGHLGKIHLALLKEINDFCLVGFYDSDTQVAEKVSTELKVEAFADSDSLIHSCEALVIVTPTPFHFTYATQAIKAGKHVFIEEPVTLNTIESKKLTQLAREAGVIGQAGYVERFNPAFIAAEKFVKRPIFIDCRRVSVYNQRGTDVSVVLDLMSHDINLILHLVKSNIKKISATGSAVLCDTEDIAEARIEFDNGCVANLVASRIALANQRKMNIFQKGNYLSLDFINKTAVNTIIKNAIPSTSENVYASFGNKHLVQETLQVRPTNSILQELELFANAIRNKSISAVTLDEAYSTMKVADEILAVIKKGLA